MINVRRLNLKFQPYLGEALRTDCHGSIILKSLLGYSRYTPLYQDFGEIEEYEERDEGYGYGYLRRHDVVVSDEGVSYRFDRVC